MSVFIIIICRIMDKSKEMIFLLHCDLLGGMPLCYLFQGLLCFVWIYTESRLVHDLLVFSNSLQLDITEFLVVQLLMGIY